MSARQDQFALFDLPRRFDTNLPDLERRFRELQSRVHPDKHAHLGDAEKLLAVQLASNANEAFQTLKSPLKRAAYLLQLAGHDIGVENNTAMPAAFLVEQMELREAVGDARRDSDESALDALRGDLKLRMKSQYESLRAVLDDEKNYIEAADRVRRLMFEEKLLQEIDDALEAIDA